MLNRRWNPNAASALANMAKILQHQVISGALALISDKANWSRGAWARTPDGAPCGWADPKAVKFCAMGALNRAAWDLLRDDICDLGVRASQQVLEASGIPHRCLPQINDSEGHAVVIAMFERALR